MLNIFLIISFVCALLILAAALLHKNIFTKILFINNGTSIASLAICFLGTYKVNSSYIDIALIYFILSVVMTSAYLKYFIQIVDNDKQKSQK